MHPINVVFRLLSFNHYSIAKLLGLLDEEFDRAKITLRLCADFSHIHDFVSSDYTTVFAYSFMTPQLDIVAREVNQLRHVIPRSDFIIAGGVHPTVDPIGSIQLGFHRVFCGEAERTLPAFIRNLIAGDNDHTPAVIEDTDLEPVSLDNYPPFAARFDFFTPIELTRGCPHRCSFCNTPQLNAHRLRFRSLEGLKKPFEILQQKNRRKLFFITSNILAYSVNGASSRHESLARLCELALEYGLTDIHLGSFPSEIRPDFLDERLMNIFDRYCLNKTIVIGAQSGSDNMLFKLNRGHSTDDVKEAAYLCKKYNFAPFVDFIFGFPEETNIDRKESLNLINWLIYQTGAKIHLHYFMPLPGTPLGDKPPSILDQDTKNCILTLMKSGRASGDIWLQYDIAQTLIRWRNEKKITV